VCANADELLKSSLNWSKEEKEIILHYRRKHLIQQYRERENLEKNKLDACNDRVTGSNQPVKALFFSDPMTCIAGMYANVVELIDIDSILGNTPVFGRSIKGDLYMTTRVIGVEVYCGDIQETFLFYTDNMVKGGANIMIEVQRRGKMNI
jgi:hypothetical protein